ncbi:hypothetical protein C8R44DRAFT_147900 [Mycena epipterygia]|nr:hypothetical protein C8R44DRAFT_147900 [Mycena epipterygia]
MHESLALQNLSKLPLALRIRAKSAVNGTDKSLGDFDRLLHNFPTEDSVLLLPVLFVHIDPAGIPIAAELDAVLATPDRHRELNLVFAATKSLRILGRMLDSAWVPSACYADLWPRLYQWIIFLHIYLDVIPDRFREFPPDQAKTVCMTIILAIESHSPMSKVVRKAARIRVILGEFWAMLLHSDGDIALEGTIPDPGIWHEKSCPILSRIFISDILDATNFQEIVDGVGSRDELVYLFVKQMHTAVASPLNDVTATTLVGVLTIVSLKGALNESFIAAMLFHGGGKALAAAVNAIEIYSQRKGERDVVAAKQMGLKFMMLRFSERLGFQWIAQALEGGLLRLIISVGSTARPTTEADVCNPYPTLHELLQDVLPSAMIHYPVACQMKKSIHEALPLITPSFMKSPLFAVWIKFAKLIENRLKALDFFESRHWVSSKACENMECLKIAVKADFKSCSGCSFVYYCSSECQKSDWEAGHRQWCDKRGYARLPGPSFARDRAYLRALLQYNFKSSAIRSTVLLSQAEFIYTHPGTEFFTLFHFNNGTGIEIVPTSEYARAADGPLRLAQLSRAGGRLQLHAVGMYATQATIVRMFPMWSNSSDLVDGLACLVKRLPSGFQFSAVRPKVVKWLSELPLDGGEVQEIY